MQHPPGQLNARPRARARRTHLALAATACAGLLLVGGALGWTARQPDAATPPPAAPDAFTPIPSGTEVELLLRDGRRLTGLIVEHSPTRVVLAINGIATPFDGTSVASVVPLPSVEERYLQLRATIDDEDIDGLLRLAEWLRARGRLDLALWEIDGVLRIEPANQNAKDLRTLVVEQQKIRDARRSPDEPASEQIGPGEADRPAFPLLTPAQINLVRLYEVDLKNPPKLLIPKPVVRRFLDRYAGRDVEGLGTVPVSPEGREVFLRQKAADVLAWMFALRAREFYPEVQVLENPASLRVFRDDVHRTWLMNTCATTRCHGGEDAGRLWLFNQRHGSDASALTNLLILSRFRTRDNLGLIDFEQPERSPLLDFGLPREQALFKHPDVAGLDRGRWRPAFVGRDDDRYLRAVQWIRMMYRPRSDYPVDYTPPRPRAEQAPPEGPR
ncbi:MAG: hypothetical protein SFY69_09525 [Planctomycetota bacterium]|nr:hypothetical protein [Planctomycetota bacterium]